MNSFLLFKIVATIAATTDAPVAELTAIQVGGVKNERTEEVFYERVQKLTLPALRGLNQGDSVPFLLLWGSLSRSEAPDDWVGEKLALLANALIEFKDRVDANRVEGELRWIPTFELMFEQSDPEKLKDINGLGILPAEHAFHEITHGRGEEVVAWFNRLSKEHREVYFSGLKMGNALLKQLPKRINPDQVDPSLVAAEHRIPVIKTYLSHPFAHQLQPFYSGTFQQMIGLKCLTPEELFENREELIQAHVRQGMAYLDLARVYRQNERYEEALACIEEGVAKYVQNGNRLGSYLLERAIILRESGRWNEAKEILAKVPVGELDRGNRELLAKIQASLRDAE